jgi:RNA recognition motif-containing protein
VQWRELKDLFAEVGEVSRADVILDQRGRSKGHGTVAFASVDAAKAAIEKFDGYELEGRPLEVREDKFSSRPFPSYTGRVNNRRGGFKPQAPRFRFNRPPPNPFTDRATGNGEPSATIFVSNLPWATTDNDLVELFRTVGPVKRAQIKLEPSGRSAGTGVVEFFEPIHAETSIARFTNYEYGGRPLSLSFVSYYAAPAPRASKYKESSEVNAAEPDAEAKSAAAPAAPAAAAPAAAKEGEN